MPDLGFSRKQDLKTVLLKSAQPATTFDEKFKMIKTKCNFKLSFSHITESYLQVLYNLYIVNGYHI